MGLRANFVSRDLNHYTFGRSYNDSLNLANTTRWVSGFKGCIQQGEKKERKLHYRRTDKMCNLYWSLSQLIILIKISLNNCNLYTFFLFSFLFNFVTFFCCFFLNCKVLNDKGTHYLVIICCKIYFIVKCSF